MKLESGWRSETGTKTWGKNFLKMGIEKLGVERLQKESFLERC
jgi:hypothetical protein